MLGTLPRIDSRQVVNITTQGNASVPTQAQSAKETLPAVVIRGTYGARYVQKEPLFICTAEKNKGKAQGEHTQGEHTRAGRHKGRTRTDRHKARTRMCTPGTDVPGKPPGTHQAQAHR